MSHKHIPSLDLNHFTHQDIRKKNQFVKMEKYKPKPPQIFIPDQASQTRTEEDNNLATEPLQDDKQEGVIEFLYDIFQENKKHPEPSNVPEEPGPL